MRRSDLRRDNHIRVIRRDKTGVINKIFVELSYCYIFLYPLTPQLFICVSPNFLPRHIIFSYITNKSEHIAVILVHYISIWD
jgi:hypothetical protein